MIARPLATTKPATGRTPGVSQGVDNNPRSTGKTTEFEHAASTNDNGFPGQTLRPRWVLIASALGTAIIVRQGLMPRRGPTRPGRHHRYFWAIAP